MVGQPGGLEGMCQRVAVVEDHAAIPFTLVGRHDVGFDGHAPRHLLLHLRLGPGRLAQEGVLRHLALPTGPLPGWSVVRVSVSQSTALGCQNAPTRFFPSGRFTPVFPPMAASTWPNSVVATFMYGVPRWYDAAANPATSVTMPPPTAMTTSERESPACANRRQRPSTVSRVLFASPSPMVADLERQARIETVQPPGLLDGRPGSPRSPAWPRRAPAGTARGGRRRRSGPGRNDRPAQPRSHASAGATPVPATPTPCTIRVATSSGLRSSTSMISSATSA